MADQAQTEAPIEKFRTQRIFATPMVTSRVGNARFFDLLEEVILKRRAEDPGITRSNRGGWHSDIKIMEWGGSPVRALVQQVLEFANANTMRADGSGGPFRWIVEGWANVNERGQSNARHIHGGCYWSAVFYVRVPPGDGGRIVFYDPRMPALAMHAPKLRFRASGGERTIRIKPLPGQLIIFPSWLDHEVEPWEGDGMRISIALNLLAAADPPPPQMGQGDPANALAATPDNSSALTSPATTPR